MIAASWTLHGLLLADSNDKAPNPSLLVFFFGDSALPQARMEYACLSSTLLPRLGFALAVGRLRPSPKPRSLTKFPYDLRNAKYCQERITSSTRQDKNRAKSLGNSRSPTIAVIIRLMGACECFRLPSSLTVFGVFKSYRTV